MNKLHLTAMMALGLAAVPAAAVTTIFSGQDDGAAVGGVFTNSLAAEASFKAAAGAFGAVKTETFESATVGDHAVVNLDDMVITTTSPNMGAGLSGVSNITLGNDFGFNVTAGGSQWYGFPHFVPTTASVTLNETTNSFGLWFTGIQSAYTAQLELELLDGTLERFSVPLNANGGTQFFGIVSDVAFTRVNLNQGGNGQSDAFGIDDISYNAAPVGIVPEPATWAMLIAGFGLVGVSLRRRKSANA